MTWEIGVSIFAAAVTISMIAATWVMLARRAPFVREIERHYQSLDSSKPALRVVRERNPTPKATEKATRRR